MIDTLLKQLPRLRAPACWNSLGLQPGRYFVVTLHRPANVDGEQQLLGLLKAIADGTHGLPVVFPVHPRTAKNLREAGTTLPSLHYVDPLGYLEFNYLVKHAKGVITDSGGITEETTVLGIPCLTLRDNTERPETMTIGTNELIGTDPRKLPPALARLMAGQWKKGAIPPKWDGKTAERIVGHLETLLAQH
jgi:UDP-N-acetylglucosamine 2-epimerase (non-hydrolysing)